ncbi:MAG: GldM family protein [Phycisphaerales bacterium]|nr:GldM family protein [Phycisphaerales bacterium]
MKKYIVDVGYPNPLDIVVEGLKCSAITVTTNNGIIKKGENNCNYIHIPERQGSSEIIISTKKDRVISTIHFIASFIKGIPVASLFGKERGEVYIDSNGTLYIYDSLSCSQIDANINGPDWDAGFIIQKFCVAIIRRGDTAFFRNNIGGNIFSEEIKQEFKKTNQDDKLIFYGMTAQGPDKRILELSPMEFTITKNSPSRNEHPNSRKMVCRLQCP